MTLPLDSEVTAMLSQRKAKLLEEVGAAIDRDHQDLLKLLMERQIISGDPIVPKPGTTLTAAEKVALFKQWTVRHKGEKYNIPDEALRRENLY